jgi:exo-beta-1,3-glucanase (GH17 family)
MRAALLLPLLILMMGEGIGAEEGKPRPLMKDFIGLNVHTVQFKPELYAPVTRVLRNYHPMKWDFGEDTAKPTTFPLAANRVNWAQLYGNWRKAGYRTHASLMFDEIAPGSWKDIARDANAYALAFAKAFGPSAKEPMIEAVEIGNEPGNYDDATYRTLFEAMARGVRAGDPALRIATCAANLGPSGRYSKSVDVFSGLDALWDIVNVHSYAEAEPWPTWRRSFPEDPATKFLENVGHVVKWRDEHARTKEVWVTEFGYDASTKPPLATGDFARWQSSTEEQQAMWSVRSFLLLARLGVDRAHLYFFNDSDEAKLHGSSGITRNFEPKPAFHALAWLQRSLGEYRFARVDREDADECYAFEFTHGTQPAKRAWVVWCSTGGPRVVRFFNDPLRVVRAERMPLVAGDAVKVDVRQETEGYMAVEASERPLIIWLEKP